MSNETRTTRKETEVAARRALDAIPTLTWRPFERDDLPAIAAMMVEAEKHDENPEKTSLSSLQEFWDAPRSRPELDTLAGWDDGGSVVAVAWSGCNRAITEQSRVFIGGMVRPDQRGRGIGRKVLAWELAHARAWAASREESVTGDLVAQLSAPAKLNDVKWLATRFGFEPARYFSFMERELGEVPDLPSISGIVLRDWDPAQSADVHRAHSEAFRDHWGHVDRTEEMWSEIIEREAFRADWSVLAVAEATEEIAGFALGAAYTQDWSDQRREGYIDLLGVRRPYRGRGIARALLVESMRRFVASGMHVASLDVDSDNPTGALGLYRGLGFVETDRECVYELRERRAIERSRGIGALLREV